MFKGHYNIKYSSICIALRNTNIITFYGITKSLHLYCCIVIKAYVSMMPPTTCKTLLKEYCSNSTIAGVRYIADDTKHWIERLLWLALVILSWYGSFLLIVAAWEAFLVNPISFGVETTYTEWDTKMPVVAVCELLNKNKIYNVSDTIWSPNHLLDLEDALKDIAYFRGFSHSLLKTCYYAKNIDPLCPLSNYSYYAKLVRSSCPEIMQNCSYNDKSFDCCEYFQSIETELGTCFAINSLQTKNPKPYPMISNMKQKRGSLYFEVLTSTAVYTLGEEEVPSITMLQSAPIKVQLGSKYRRHLAVRTIENDPLVIKTSPEQRACLFHHENEGGLYPHYSYSACTVRCRKKAQIDECQCNDHFMLDTTEKDHCNISGLGCITSRVSHLSTLKPHWARRPGMACDCMPSCDETEITVIKDVSIVNRGKRKKAEVELVLAYLPTERFKRNVVRSQLDLVVSIGGTIGLFVGASLLSFVELIFYFTVRYISNHLITRRRRNGKI